MNNFKVLFLLLIAAFLGSCDKDNAWQDEIATLKERIDALENGKGGTSIPSMPPDTTAGTKEDFPKPENEGTAGKDPSFDYSNAEKRTVLYSDGLLIINELIKDARFGPTPIMVWNPIEEDGTYKEVDRDRIYEPLRSTYREHNVYCPEWIESLTFFNDYPLKAIKIGSPIKPQSTRGWFLNFYGDWIDLSNLDTERLTDMSYMFAGCKADVYVSESFSTKNVQNTKDIFLYSWIKGSKGSESVSYTTAPNSNYPENIKYYGIERARIDGGPSSPGVFRDIKDKNF